MGKLLICTILIASLGCLLRGASAVGGGGASAFLSGSKDTKTKEERFLEQQETFLKVVKGLENKTNLTRGLNLLRLNENKVDAFEELKRKATRGVKVEIINYSKRILGVPRTYNRCGYIDEEYGLPQVIAPGGSDIFLLHNKDKRLTSSCGSLSWQVLDNNGKSHRVQGGNGVRLYVSWSSLDAVRSNKCAKGKRNEFVVGFEEIELDSMGHAVTEWKEKKVYKKVHTDQIIKESNVLTENNTLSAMVHSPDGELEVHVVMGPDCLSTIKVQVVGHDKAAMDILDRNDTDVYTSDEIWEQMIRQAWLDIVSTINRDKALYGVPLTPMEVDSLLDKPINIHEEIAGYMVDLSMWNVTVHGIKNIDLDKLILERGQGLNNLREKAIISMGNLTVKGMYQYKAKCTAWICIVSEFDSEGPQPFSIEMEGAKLNVVVKMDTVNECGKDDNLIISELNLPLEYQKINYNFTNIGNVLGTAVGLIGGMALQFSFGMVRDMARNAVLQEVPSLICERESEEEPRNISFVNRLTPLVDPAKDEAWYNILQQGTQGWGWDILRRDFLAENFIKKVFEDGVLSHLSNDSDPIVKALDPFQLLAASEDIHERGLIKGHVVACELFLRGLRGLNLIDMELVRNEDLTYSALRVTIGLPEANLTGKFRLNHLKVFSIIPLKDSEGTVDAHITGIKVVLTIVLRTNRVANEKSNALIQVTHFEVDFQKDRAVIDVKGLGGTTTSKITNKGIKKIGNKVVTIMKDAVNTEIKTVIWGLVKCLMYKPGEGFNTCMDNYWQCLGFEVPFTFPTCPAMYKQADAEIAKFSSYRDYLKDYKMKKEEKAKNVAANACLKRP